MSSINPVILLSGALEERGEAIAKGFVGALTLGAGQFCTNPGLLLAVDSPALERFLEAVNEALAGIPASTMLSDGIHRAYCSGVDVLGSHPDVELVAKGAEAEGLVARASLFSTTADKFQSDPRLRDEVFGASSLLVRCRDIAELREILSELEGQLTIAIHAADSELATAAEILLIAERLAGRILFNGFGTGVEVCNAMVHGGPFPATSDVRTTSVGSLAIDRFLRPICYQDVPSLLLPTALQDGNPTGIPVRINGQRQ
jgi:NADP-dependent aldehyde dehydrogenase